MTAAPVLEPSTIFLMGLGLAGLIGIRARKKN
ncbi:MAG: PEP-CTERM sorting domain-containing protein [Deltaproteobacteria bacterium]|nr:PEP-CTERM sorting domain-containing protein [Candidatus Anaeroferrophillus wilburensis]MBN2889257.1 PEP-CTERM sorting domain-containing protein [Deltaproteobacteria bacterium]